MKKTLSVLLLILFGFPSVGALLETKVAHAEPCSIYEAAAILAFGDEPCDPDEEDDGGGGGGNEGGGGGGSLCAPTHYDCNGTAHPQVNEADDLEHYEWSCTEPISGEVENCTEPINGDGVPASISIDYINNSAGDTNSSGNPQNSGSYGGPIVYYSYGSPGGTAALDNIEIYVDNSLHSYSYVGSGSAGAGGSGSFVLAGLTCSSGNTCGYTIFLVAHFVDVEFNNNYGDAVSSQASVYVYTPPPVNGACGSGVYVCTAGSAINQSHGYNSYTWACTGSYGGSNTSCSYTPSGTINPVSNPSASYPAVAASCTIPSGSSSCNINFGWSTVNYYDYVSRVLRPDGTLVIGNTLSEASYPFTIYGSDPSPVTFSLYNGDTLLARSNVTASCASGTNWNGSTCAPIVNGACSATHYSCSTGTSASNVEGSTAWTWSCNGSNSGANVSCSETKVSGVCSATHYSCSTGTSASNVEGSTAWTWSCTSPNGGASASCSESKPATISVDVTPNSASWTISPGSLGGSGDDSKTVNPDSSGSTYTITPGSAPSGYDFPPTISNSQGGGSSMTLFDGGSAGFTITYARSFNYTLSNDGMDPVQKGGGSYVAHGQTTITKTLASDSGTPKPVDLSISGLPTGVSLYSISGNPAQPDSESTIDLAVSASAAAGTYPITVTGSPLGKSTSFNLVINNSPDIFVSCSASGTRQVGQQITWTANVTQTPSEAPYAYYWTGTNIPTEPAPSTASFGITYTTTGAKTASALVTDSKGNTGVCNPQGSINIGVTPIFEEF